jgi:pimeloyl-ACP methyl ester carboxylesterase
VDFEEIVVETDRLAFPALAAGSGPPVLCWHGFPDHPATFGPLAEYLVAAGRRVVAPFLRGHHPDTVDAVTYTDGITLAADAAAVAEALAEHPGEGVDMIGHDIGAGMVQRVAAAWPDRLRRGVTMSVPPPSTLRSVFADPAQQRRSFYVWLFQLEGIAEAILNNDRSLIDFLWATWSPGLTDLGAHRQRVHDLYGDPRFIRNALRVYRGNFDTSLHDPSLANLARTTEAPADTPLMLLAGVDDGCIAASLFDNAASGLATGSRVEIVADAGHFLHLEQPATIAELALSWFDPA